MWAIGRLVAKLRSCRGFTLVELLVTMVMMIMASAVIVQALAFSYKVYFARTGDIEAQLLCQTVSLLVQDDLTRHGSPYYTINSNLPSYATISMTVDNIAKTATLTDVTNISINGTTLPAACYGYGSGAAVERTVSIELGNLTADKPTNGYYKVTVSVKNKGLPVATNTFTVYPLNIT